MNPGTNYSEPSYHNLAPDALEKNVEEYPFSSLARYLLLRHYRETGNADFGKHLKRTALYFNNDNWLQFQLNQVQAAQDTFVDDPGFKDDLKENQPRNHFAVATDEELNVSHHRENVDETEQHFNPETQILGSHIEGYLQAENVYNGNPGDENINTGSEDFIPDSETLGTHIENISHAESHKGYENNTPEIIHENEIPVPITETLGNHLDNISGEEFHADYGTIREEIPGNNEMVIPDTQSLGSHHEDTWNLSNEDHTVSISAETNDEQITASDAEIQEPVEQYSTDNNLSENNSADVIFENPTTIEDNSDTNSQIAFEPFHTVDYFASQGIKITEEVLANDKLGTQMKSFTEWLKSMKKLHPLKLPEENSLAEDIIQSAAEVSNIDTEVLTEAMAEVLIKQDKKDKAVEMYNKLSLINPSKSAYFAAKIESIKST